MGATRLNYLSRPNVRKHGIEIQGEGDQTVAESSTDWDNSPLGLDAEDFPDGLVVADETGQVVVFNSVAARLTGVEPDEVLGKHLADEVTHLRVVLRITLDPGCVLCGFAGRLLHVSRESFRRDRPCAEECLPDSSYLPCSSIPPFDSLR